MKDKYYLALVNIWLLLFPYELLAQTDSDKKSGDYSLFAIIYLVAVWAYPGNKWRLWKIGFSIGAADKNDFFSAVKWTVIAIILTVVPFWLLFQFSGK